MLFVAILAETDRPFVNTVNRPEGLVVARDSLLDTLLERELDLAC